MLFPRYSSMDSSCCFIAGAVAVVVAVVALGVVVVFTRNVCYIHLHAISSSNNSTSCFVV